VYPTFSRTEVTFPDSLEMTGIPEAIKEQLLAYSYQFGGVDVRVFGYGPSFYGGGGSPPNYSIQVYGYNYEKVREIAEDLGRRLSSSAGSGRWTPTPAAGGSGSGRRSWSWTWIARAWRSTT
jgi:hypothetical protein